jgi:hypothetical protein
MFASAFLLFLFCIGCVDTRRQKHDINCFIRLLLSCVVVLLFRVLLPIAYNCPVYSSNFLPALLCHRKTRLEKLFYRFFKDTRTIPNKEFFSPTDAELRPMIPLYLSVLKTLSLSNTRQITQFYRKYADENSRLNWIEEQHRLNAAAVAASAMYKGGGVNQAPGGIPATVVGGWLRQSNSSGGGGGGGGVSVNSSISSTATSQQSIPVRIPFSTTTTAGAGASSGASAYAEPSANAANSQAQAAIRGQSSFELDYEDIYEGDDADSTAAQQNVVRTNTSIRNSNISNKSNKSNGHGGAGVGAGGATTSGTLFINRSIFSPM